MNFIKEVLKKLLIAIVTGTIILAFVYYKDHYLEQGNSDMEMLNSVNLEKQTQDEEVQKKETDTASTVDKEDSEEKKFEENKTKPSLAIEVEKPYEKPEVQDIQKEVEPIKKETPMIVEKKVIVKKRKKEIKKVEEELENEIKKYRGTLPEVEPIEKETPQETTFNEVKSSPKKNMISNKKVSQEKSFEEFKSSVKSRAQSAFDELDSEKF